MHTPAETSQSSFAEWASSRPPIAGPSVNPS